MLGCGRESSQRRESKRKNTANRIRQALEATRHLLEMYRRQLGDEKIRRRLRRLDQRLLTVASQLQRIQTEQK